MTTASAGSLDCLRAWQIARRTVSMAVSVAFGCIYIQGREVALDVANHVVMVLAGELGYTCGTFWAWDDTPIAR